jgi:predicted DNA-binding ribbon-helix-helix protein
MNVGSGKTRAYSLEDSLWKSLWSCSNTHYMVVLLLLLLLAAAAADDDNVDDICRDIVYSGS